MRVLRIGFLANDPRPFGPWGLLFESLVGRKFNDFVKNVTGRAVDAIVPALVRALHSPTVLLADDAQYLNDEALSLLAAFARLASGAGHAVVVTARPEGRARLDRVLENVHELQLERLTETQLQDALEAASLDVSPVFAKAIFKRTSGNPMFIESLLDAFVKNGELRREEGHWRFTSTPGTDIVLPGTLSRTIESRLRSRGPNAAAVACALSLEPEASADDLQAVLELGETTVLDALDDLLSLEVLDQPSSGPMFAFSHDLLRERAETLLNVARRIRLHRRFAGRLEGARIPGGALRRARHLAAAREPLLAAEAYLEAALHAMELNATQESLDRGRRGIELLKQVEAGPDVDRITMRLHEAMTRTLRRANRYDDAGSQAREAIRYARSSGDTEVLLGALLRYASVQTDLGTIGASAEAAEALALSRHTSNHRLRAHAHASACFGHLWSCRESEAMEAGRAGLEIALESGDARVIFASGDPLARAQSAWWRFADAQDTYAIMRERIAGVSWIAGLTSAAWEAHYHYFTRNITQAGKEIEPAIQALAARPNVGSEDFDIGIPAIYYLAEGFDALIAIERGEYDAALRYADVARRYPTAPSFYSNYSVMVPLDALLLRDGRGDAARALALLADLSELYYGPWISSHLVPNALRARVAARLRDSSAAALVGDALDEAERVALLCPGDCYRAFDRLAVAAGDIGAVDLSARAVDLRDRYLAKHAAAVAELGTTESIVAGTESSPTIIPQ